MEESQEEDHPLDRIVNFRRSRRRRQYLQLQRMQDQQARPTQQVESNLEFTSASVTSTFTSASSIATSSNFIVNLTSETATKSTTTSSSHRIGSNLLKESGDDNDITLDKNKTETININDCSEVSLIETTSVDVMVETADEQVDSYVAHKSPPDPEPSESEPATLTKIITTTTTTSDITTAPAIQTAIEDDVTPSVNAVRILFGGQQQSQLRQPSNQISLNQPTNSTISLVDPLNSIFNPESAQTSQSSQIIEVNRQSIEQQIEALRESDERRWNFDFRNCIPLQQSGHRYLYYATSTGVRNCRPLNNNNQESNPATRFSKQ